MRMGTRSRRSATGLLLALTLLLPAAAGAAVDEEDFKADTTEDLVQLCTASEDDPKKEEAVHFCHGYLVGAYDYHMAESSGPEVERLVCVPESVTQNQAVGLFVRWANAHPEYKNELPVETFFRFMITSWPCNG
jgi:hypothetical protein